MTVTNSLGISIRKCLFGLPFGYLVDAHTRFNAVCAYKLLTFAA